MTALARMSKLPPHLLFREGFKVAGDDMLLDVIQRCVLPALQTRLQQAGVTDAAALLATLFGDSGRIDPGDFASTNGVAALYAAWSCGPLLPGNKAILTIRSLVCMPPLGTPEPTTHAQRDELHPTGYRPCVASRFASV